jgi:hypothetical protein
MVGMRPAGLNSSGEAHHIAQQRVSRDSSHVERVQEQAQVQAQVQVQGRLFVSFVANINLSFVIQHLR